MYFNVPTGAFRSVSLAICLFICYDLISPAVTADRLTTSQIILKFYLWNKAIVIHSSTCCPAYGVHPGLARVRQYYRNI